MNKVLISLVLATSLIQTQAETEVKADAKTVATEAATNTSIDLKLAKKIQGSWQGDVSKIKFPANTPAEQADMMKKMLAQMKMTITDTEINMNIGGQEQKATYVISSTKGNIVIFDVSPEKGPKDTGKIKIDGKSIIIIDGAQEIPFNAI